MPDRLLIVALIALQGLAALFFSGRILLSIAGVSMRPLPWQIVESLEIVAALALLGGTGLGIAVLRRSFRERNAARRRLGLASAAFHDNLEARFAGWGLTSAERDVALFAIKGMSTGDIAGLRGTSEGTVKAQSTAIYRKAGVNSRAQLVSLIVEDFFDDENRSAGG